MPTKTRTRKPTATEPEATTPTVVKADVTVKPRRPRKPTVPTFEVVKAPEGTGWDLTSNGKVVSHFDRKADALAERRQSIADAEQVAAEATAPRPEPTPEPTVDPASMTAAARIVAAKAEAAATKAWKAAGSVGEPPARPVLDFMAQPHDRKPRKASTGSGSGSGRKVPEATVKLLLEVIRAGRQAGLGWDAMAADVNANRADIVRPDGTEWVGRHLYHYAWHSDIPTGRVAKS